MKKFYVNIKREKIFATEVWAESRAVAVFKANMQAQKSEDTWNDGRITVYVRPATKWI